MAACPFICCRNWIWCPYGLNSQIYHPVWPNQNVFHVTRIVNGAQAMVGHLLPSHSCAAPVKRAIYHLWLHCSQTGDLWCLWKLHLAAEKKSMALTWEGERRGQIANSGEAKIRGEAGCRWKEVVSRSPQLGWWVGWGGEDGGRKVSQVW